MSIIEKPASFFCSEYARAASETLIGTAPYVKRWLLIEYPGTWASDAIDGSTLAPAVKQHLAHCGAKVLFIRQRYEADSRIAVLIVENSETSPRIYSRWLSSYDELIDMDMTGDPVDGPLYLVCTHGTHDKCCAKFGLPFYRALSEAFPLETWQCSHVGGDRFAANAIFFPEGIYYGQLGWADAQNSAKMHQKGLLNMHFYRGRACFSHVLQAGEHLIRLSSGILRIDALRYHSHEQRSPNSWCVRFSGEGQLFEVEFERRTSAELRFATCRAMKPTHAHEYRLLSFRAT
jgi:hypothetical protein